jgi:hypothetical protein
MQQLERPFKREVLAGLTTAGVLRRPLQSMRATPQQCGAESVAGHAQAH